MCMIMSVTDQNNDLNSFKLLDVGRVQITFQLKRMSVYCVVKLLKYRVLTLPGKPDILLFTFPGLENVWNLLKKN